MEHPTGIKPATLSLQKTCSINWATGAKNWQEHRDLNPDKQFWRLLCLNRYTMFLWNWRKMWELNSRHLAVDMFSKHARQTDIRLSSIKLNRLIFVFLKRCYLRESVFKLAQAVGIEPTTFRLTVELTTIVIRLNVENGSRGRTLTYKSLQTLG